MILHLKEKWHVVDTIWVFRFMPSEPVSWTPGQYMRVELPHERPDDEGTKRWFTISSAPYEQVLQITTRVTGSTFKQALSQLEVGGELQMIEMPEGDFVWEDSELPKVFVAAGIGVTPFHSILKQRAHDHQALDVTLVYGGRTEELPFKDEIRLWQSQDSRLVVHYIIGERLTPENITQRVPRLNQSLVYVSGPEAMVRALGDALKQHGLSQSQLKHDDFPNYTEENY